MRPLLPFLAAAPVLLIVGGCQPSAGPAQNAPEEARYLLKTEEDIASLLPKPGEARAYRATIKTSVNGVTSMTEERLFFKFEGKGSERKVTILRGGKVVDNQTWALRNGLVILGQGNKKFNPPYLLAGLIPPGTLVEKRTVGPRGDGTHGTLSYSVNTSSVEEVDLAEGRAEGQPFDSAQRWTGPKGASMATTRSWWAPGKGLLRQVESIKWEGVEREIVSILEPIPPQGKPE